MSHLRLSKHKAREQAAAASQTPPPPPSAFAIVPALETEFQFTEVITRLNGSAEAAGLSLAKINKMNK